MRPWRSVCEVIHSKIYTPDPDNEENAFLHEVISQLEEKLNCIWDKLPIDTIIATFLDPRIKTSMEQIPKREQTAAMLLLEKVSSREIACIHS